MKSDIEKLIIDNMGLVGKVAKSYMGKSEFGFDDLYQQGCLGLIDAAKSYDESKGTKFSSYATFLIQCEISKMLRECRLVKVAKETQQLSYHVNKVIRKFKKDHGTEPTISEIAKVMNCSEKVIGNAMNSSIYPLSLETVIPNTDGAKLEEKLESNTNIEEEIIENYQRRQLYLHIMLLPKMYQSIILLRLQGLNRTRIAKAIGYSQSYVGRCLKIIIETLKETMEFDIRENEIERVSVNG